MPFALPHTLLTLALALMGAALIARLSRVSPAPAPRAALTEEADAGPVFLFTQGRLVDCCAGGAEMIAAHRAAMGELRAVRFALATDFPQLDALIDAQAQGVTRLSGRVQDLEVEQRGPRLRLKLRPHDPSGAALDLHAAERTLLREVADGAPHPSWTEAEDGTLLWANAAFLSLCDEHFGPGPGGLPRWPDRTPFPDLRSTLTGQVTSLRRIALDRPDGDGRDWFDVTSQRRARDILHHATGVNATVRAEQERTTMAQLFSETFSTLSIGLAVFDEDRRLKTFNPAFTDLLGLPVEMLTRRPALDDLLDRLRDSGRLPEPRDYAAWRRRFAALGTDEGGGHYQEKWALPDGQVLRVTGRPHPQGSFMLLFEDISAEVHQTRRFRADLETCQAMLDHVDDAMVVFSPAGTLVATNAAYDRDWGNGDRTALDSTAETALEHWEGRCSAAQDWAGLTAILKGRDPGPGWRSTLTRRDGQVAPLTARRLKGGATLIQFTAPDRGPARSLRREGEIRLPGTSPSRGKAAQRSAMAKSDAQTA